MDLEELLLAIIEILDDDEDPWVKEVLTWWNQYLRLSTNLVYAKSSTQAT